MTNRTGHAKDVLELLVLIRAEVGLEFLSWLGLLQAWMVCIPSCVPALREGYDPGLICTYALDTSMSACTSKGIL